MWDFQGQHGDWGGHRRQLPSVPSVPSVNMRLGVEWQEIKYMNILSFRNWFSRKLPYTKSALHISKDAQSSTFCAAFTPVLDILINQCWNKFGTLLWSLTRVLQPSLSMRSVFHAIEQHRAPSYPLQNYCFRRCLTCVDHICTHLSNEPLARYLPDGLKATLYTGSWCLVSVWIQMPLSTSHNLTVESNDALWGNTQKDDSNTKTKLCLYIFFLLFWMYSTDRFTNRFKYIDASSIKTY